jgi:hypothetical protein
MRHQRSANRTRADKMLTVGLSGLLLATLTALTGCQLEFQAPEEDPAQPGESAPDQPATAAPDQASAREATTRLAMKRGRGTADSERTDGRELLVRSDRYG